MAAFASLTNKNMPDWVKDVIISKLSKDGVVVLSGCKMAATMPGVLQAWANKLQVPVIASIGRPGDDMISDGVWCIFYPEPDPESMEGD